MTPKKNTLTMQTVEIRKLKPHPQNARTHSPEQLKAIGDSLKELGWTRPILVNEHNVILAGHGTVKAARQIGMTEAPIVVRSGLTQAQQRAYVLADNALAERSAWDSDLLSKEMLDLKSMGIDLGLTGFDPDEIARLISPPQPARDDEPPIPEAKGPAVSRVGDVWALGRHRVICGDSTLSSTLEALMQGEQAQVVFTDPPYGVSYEAQVHIGAIDHTKIAGDDKRRRALRAMLFKAFSAAMPHCKNEAGWYIWHACFTRDDYAQAMRDAGLVELGYIIWEKPALKPGWGDYQWAHEPCFYMVKQGYRPDFYGDRTNSSVWRVERSTATSGASLIGNGILIGTANGQEIYITTAAPKGKKVRNLYVEAGQQAIVSLGGPTEDVWLVGRDNTTKANSFHLTQKPVELARRAIKNSTTEGQIVLDFFGGSGSTLMGAEQTGRKAYVVELDPANVDVIVRRWQEYTSLDGIHADTGKPFNDTKPRTKAQAKAAA